MFTGFIDNFAKVKGGVLKEGEQALIFVMREGGEQAVMHGLIRFYGIRHEQNPLCGSQKLRIFCSPGEA
jgi:hypothetical protein